MSDPALSVVLSPDLARELDRLAEQTQRETSSLVTDAVAAFVAHEQAIAAGVQRGLEDAETGRTVSHAVAMERVRAAINKR